jgi:hypothetical protein
VLRALEWLIKKSSLPPADFYNVQMPVVVTANITGVTAEVLDSLEQAHRNKIKPLVVDGSITLRRTQLVPSDSVANFRLEIFIANENGGEWRLNPTGIDTAIKQLFPEPIFIGAMENATEDVGKFSASSTIGKLLKEIIESNSTTRTSKV